MDERPNEDKVEQVERLLSRVGLRDAAAFKSLYALVSPRLMAVAYRVLQDRALAEDVLQEVFIKVWNESVPRPPGQPKTLAWLCVTTRNRAIDVIRKKRPETPLSWLDDNGDEHFHDVQDETHSPLTQLLERATPSGATRVLRGLDASANFDAHAKTPRDHQSVDTP
jgi:RNA polymerase sigma-70 factor (ECF subfamily)